MQSFDTNMGASLYAADMALLQRMLSEIERRLREGRADDAERALLEEGRERFQDWIGARERTASRKRGASRMQLQVENFVEQSRLWPSEGRHILAKFDEGSVVVYQAYRREIGLAAVRQGCFAGGGFSFDRMSGSSPTFCG